MKITVEIEVQQSPTESYPGHVTSVKVNGKPISDDGNANGIDRRWYVLGEEDCAGDCGDYALMLHQITP